MLGSFAEQDCLSAENVWCGQIQGDSTIKATNRRLQKELGHNAAEKLGHEWMLTDFVVEIWGITKEETENR